MDNTLKGERKNTTYRKTCLLDHLTAIGAIGASQCSPQTMMALVHQIIAVLNALLAGHLGFHLNTLRKPI